MHVYFSGIGGVGIGPLALLALGMDYKVSGSDLKESEMTKVLETKKVALQIGQDGTQVAKAHEAEPIDWFVYSAALPADHPELQFAKDNGIKATKRSDFLNHLLQEKNLKLVAISGTHGKTTTTAMIVWLFKQLNLPISYSIGTQIDFGNPGQYEPASSFFVYECDEFDKNFLDFKPEISVIPSMDYDHADTYPTQAEYVDAFKTFVGQSASTFLWQRTATALGLTASDVITIFNDRDPQLEEVKLPGFQMRKNALLAAYVAHQMVPEQSLELFIGLLAGFPGTGRRFEKLAENIYTDYAHHPVEIAATISMAKELNPKVVVVYQPHQNVRQHEIVREDAYRQCFNGIMQLYWLPTYLSREQKDLVVLSPTELIVSVNPDVEAEYDEMNEGLWEKIKTHSQKGHLVVAMSAGDLDDWLRKQVETKLPSN